MTKTNKTKLEAESRSKLEQTIESLKGQLRVKSASMQPRAPRRGGNRRNLKDNKLGQNAPTAESRLLSGREPNTQVFRTTGTVKIASILLDGSALTSGMDEYVVMSREISPQAFEGDNTQNLARAFAKFRFTRLNFDVRPMVTTSASGGWMAAYLPDATTELPGSNPTALSNLMLSNRWSNAGAIWQGTAEMRGESVQDIKFPGGGWFYTSQSAQAMSGQSLTTSQGRFAVALSGPVTGITGFFTIEVMCNFDVEFCEPMSRQTPQEISAVVLDPPIQPCSYIIGADTYLTAVEPANADYLAEITNDMQVYTDAIYVIEPNFGTTLSSNGFVMQYAWISTSSKGKGMYLTNDITQAFKNGTASPTSNIPVQRSEPVDLYPIPGQSVSTFRHGRVSGEYSGPANAGRKQCELVETLARWE